MPPQATTSCGRPEGRFVRFYKSDNISRRPWSTRRRFRRMRRARSLAAEDPPEDADPRVVEQGGHGRVARLGADQRLLDPDELPEGSAPRSRVRFRGVASSSLAPVRHGVTGAPRRSAGGLHRKITLHEHPTTPARDIAWSHRRTDRDRRRHHHRPCPGRRRAPCAADVLARPGRRAGATLHALRRGRLPISAVGGGSDRRRAGRGLRSVHGALVRQQDGDGHRAHGGSVRGARQRPVRCRPRRPGVASRATC